MSDTFEGGGFIVTRYLGPLFDEDGVRLEGSRQRIQITHDADNAPGLRPLSLEEADSLRNSLTRALEAAGVVVEGRSSSTVEEDPKGLICWALTAHGPGVRRRILRVGTWPGVDGLERVLGPMLPLLCAHLSADSSGSYRLEVWRGASVLEVAP